MWAAIIATAVAITVVLIIGLGYMVYKAIKARNVTGRFAFLRNIHCFLARAVTEAKEDTTTNINDKKDDDDYKGPEPEPAKGIFFL